MRLMFVSVPLLFAVLAGCSTPQEIAAREAAELARVGAEDDVLCRRVGFRQGAEQYRLCRNQRTVERATEKASEIAEQEKKQELISSMQFRSGCSVMHQSGDLYLFSCPWSTTSITVYCPSMSCIVPSKPIS